MSTWIADVNLRLHHDGDEDFRGEAEFHAVETCLGHADDGHLVIVERERFTDDLGIGGETGFPKVIVENDVGMAAGDYIVGGGGMRPRAGTRRELKSRCRKTNSTETRSAAGRRRGWRSWEAAKHIGEDLVVLAEIAEHGMGDGITAPVAAVVAAHHGEQDELLRVLDGEKDGGEPGQGG